VFEGSSRGWVAEWGIDLSFLKATGRVFVGLWGFWASPSFAFSRSLSFLKARALRNEARRQDKVEDVGLFVAKLGRSDCSERVAFYCRYFSFSSNHMHVLLFYPKVALTSPSHPPRP